MWESCYFLEYSRALRILYMSGWEYVESSGKQEPKTCLASRAAVPSCSSSQFQDPKKGLRRSWTVSEHVRTSLLM